MHTLPVLREGDGYDGEGNNTPELADDVRHLQTLLVARGYVVDVDGLFGPITVELVREFQTSRALVADGDVGRLTWACLIGFAPDNPELLAELALARGFADAITSSASEFALAPSTLAGIGSRESGWGRFLRPVGPAGTGDFTHRHFPTALRPGPLPTDGGGFGRGLLQIDWDFYAFARTGPWRDPAKNIHQAAAILAAMHKAIAADSNLEGFALLRASVAAYNCGSGNVLKAIARKLDLDSFTSGANYAADTLNRAEWFEGQGFAGPSSPPDAIA